MNIGILHYRVGGTDGVSLEIDKRKNVLASMGHNVVLVAGPKSSGSSYTIPELAIPSSNDVFSDKSTKKIEDGLMEIHSHEKIDTWFIHNILSLGRHPSSAKATLDFLDKVNVHTIAIHHDFYWERADIMDNITEDKKSLFETYHVPKRPYLTHVVINSRSREALISKFGIVPYIVPDVFDFNKSPNNFYSGLSSAYIKKLLGIPSDGFVILQATRIVPRKGIELGIKFASILQKTLNKRIYFVFSNIVDTAEHSAMSYLQRLKSYAQGLNVCLLYAQDILKDSLSKYPNFWDYYRIADIVSYPSLYEGYGNQFLEALFFKKPVVVFEYAIYRRDIKPKGYKVLSLGDTYTLDSSDLACVDLHRLRNAVNTYVNWKNSNAIPTICDYNFNIAKSNNSLEILKEHFENVLNT